MSSDGTEAPGVPVAGEVPPTGGPSAAASSASVSAPCTSCTCGGGETASGAAEGGDSAPPPPPSSKPLVKRVVSRVRRIPDEILEDKQLAAAIAQLPKNYNFEIHKTVWRLKEAGARRVALQFPEGLLMYACTIADILERFAGVCEVVVLGDVTYGACCVDDLTAQALGADFLVHYGHSCLVPVDVTAVKCLYVFVEIAIDPTHLAHALTHNIPAGRRVCLMGTIQFVAALHEAAALLQQQQPRFARLHVPQAKPLSPGEVLGCTAPRLGEGEWDVLVFVADGRFHLEAAMIANPGLEALRYNPYDRSLTREHYDTTAMHALRRSAVEAGRQARRWGVILGTLGRQGNPALLGRVLQLLTEAGRAKEGVVVMLLSEITPAKLVLMRESVECWVQVACPRLSIDWGHGFHTAVLTPYELEVAMGTTPPWEEVYPMDYYARGSGPWTNLHPDNKKRSLPPHSTTTPSQASQGAQQQPPQDAAART